MPDGIGYEQFIEDVYINSIRSVLIIDDDYPTFQEVLSNEKRQDPSRAKSWHSQPEKVLNVVNHFRQKRNWLVDIHDGLNIPDEVELSIASHLYQSDLLILDYQLEQEAGRGDLAIKVLHTLAQTPHFNMVVVHTGNDVLPTFSEVLLSFMQPILGNFLEEQRERAEEILEKLEDDNDGVSEKISKSLNIQTYTIFRKNPKCLRQWIKDEVEFLCGALAHCSELKIGEKILLFKYNFSKLEEKLLNENFFSQDTYEKVLWPNSGSGPKWVRVGNVFIAIANKDEAEQTDLPTILHQALVDWNPMPSRLILSKIRMELERNGVVAEDKVLDDPKLFAFWYKDLLSGKTDGARFSEIRKILQRHAIDLMQAIENPVMEFSKNLIEFELAENGKVNGIVKTRFGVDLDNNDAELESARAHNAYVCSHLPSGWHLNNGHVLSFDGHFWVCLSPSCDLVPKQKTGGHFGEMKGYMPFFAVRLYPASQGLDQSDINSNRFLFIEIGGEIKNLSFNDPVDDRSNPHWYLLYASNDGEFSPNTMELTVFKGRWCEETNELKYSSHEACVIKQLYPEYAINLTQRLGQNFTRVGLGFK